MYAAASQTGAPNRRETTCGSSLPMLLSRPTAPLRLPQHLRLCAPTIFAFALRRMSLSRTVVLLLAWFERSARDLPWRRTQDPYAIWVSEIMLQQTQVKTVTAYWQRWMRELPNLRTLARARPQRVYKLWEGLGYYTRVRNLQAGAQVILRKHGGQFPTRFEEVLELPGIGRYTAGAICSIAFNQPRPVLDGNVVRVLTRAFGIKGDPKLREVNDELWAIAERLVSEAARLEGERPAGRPGLNTRGSPASRSGQARLCSALNQSLMELGALVCTPRQPCCKTCPLAKLCIARKQGQVELLPRRTARAPMTRRRFAAFVGRRDGKVLVRQRPAGVINAQLWEFPNVEVPNDDGDPVAAGVRALGLTPSQPRHLRTIQHSITRYRIRLDVYQIPAEELARLGQNAGRWITRGEAKRLAFTGAHKRILDGL